MMKLLSANTRGSLVCAFIVATIAAFLVPIPGYAASTQVLLTPAADIATDNVQGLASGSTSMTNLWQNIDDGTSFASADDDASVVQTPAGKSGSHTVSYSAAPTGRVVGVTANLRARHGKSSKASAKVLLFDGTTLVATGPVHSLDTSYQSFSDTFAGLSLASAENLRTKVQFDNNTGQGEAMYTEAWLAVTLGTTATIVAPTTSTTAAPTTTTTTVAPTTTTTSPPPAPTDLLASKGLIYGSEIGAWQVDAKPAVDTSTPIPSKVVEAAIPTIRFAAYDCFQGETCGTDNHAGSLSRTNVDNAILGIVNNLRAVPWIKLLPITKAGIGSVSNGSVFCPPLSNLAMNLPIYKSLITEIRSVYAGPIIIESTNEAEFSCWATWGYTGGGAVGVSKTLGDHYAANMPALLKYARDTLGFSQVVTVGYVGVGGGTNWGQSCTPNLTSAYGYACTYQARWVNEFNTAVKAAYVSSGNDPDYIPNVQSIHAYCHSADFAAHPFTFDDRICLAYYRNWISQSRNQVSAIWGTTVGSGMRFAISEWNAGACSNLLTNCWSGWFNPSSVQSFYDGWLGMLRGDGNTTGSGTRYWGANVFEIASNSDTSAPGYYNIIRKDGSVPAWYSNFKTFSTTDPNR